MSLPPNGRMIFAQRRSDRAWVGVHEVSNGLRCGCVCPECGAALVARQGPDRSAHFSHAPGSASCGMGWWHTVIRDTIAGLPCIDLGQAAPVPRLRGRHWVVRAGREETVLDGEFQLDVFLWLQSGLKLAVEVVDTSDITGFKFAALEQEGYQVLRIDVAAVRKAMHDIPATAENLRGLLASRGGWQSWPEISEAPVQESLRLTRPWSNLIERGLQPWRHGLLVVRTAWSRFESGHS